VLVLAEDKGKEIAFELAPIEYDEWGFVSDSPVIGREYKAQPDTPRETAAKTLDRAAPPASLMGPAHSNIKGDTPFIRPVTGIAAGLAETVHVHEIIVSGAEAVRTMAAEGLDTAGWWQYFAEGYPEGISTVALREIIAGEKARAAKPQSMAERYADWVVGADAPAAETRRAADERAATEIRTMSA